jgi:hypothetical protein
VSRKLAPRLLAYPLNRVLTQRVLCETAGFAGVSAGFRGEKISEKRLEKS